MKTKAPEPFSFKMSDFSLSMLGEFPMMSEFLFWIEIFSASLRDVAIGNPLKEISAAKPLQNRPPDHNQRLDKLPRFVQGP